MTPTETMNRISNEVYQHFKMDEARRMCLFLCRYMDIKIRTIMDHFKTSQTAIASANEIVTRLILSDQTYRSRYEQILTTLTNPI